MIVEGNGPICEVVGNVAESEVACVQRRRDERMEGISIRKDCSTLKESIEGSWRRVLKEVGECSRRFELNLQHSLKSS